MRGWRNRKLSRYIGQPNTTQHRDVVCHRMASREKGQPYEGMVRDPCPPGGYPPVTRRPNPESDFQEVHWPKSKIKAIVSFVKCLVRRLRLINNTANDQQRSGTGTFQGSCILTRTQYFILNLISFTSAHERGYVRPLLPAYRRSCQRHKSDCHLETLLPNPMRTPGMGDSRGSKGLSLR